MHIRRKQLSLQYAIKLSSTPENPTYECVFEINNATKVKFEQKPKEIKPFGLRVLEDLAELNFSKDSTSNFALSKTPFWQMSSPEINLALTNFKKEETHPDIFKKEYNELIQKYHSYETIFTDGSKSDNAVGSATVHIKKNKKEGNEKNYKDFL